MYRVMAIANYEDRFVIPTTHREYAENAFNVRGGCGFSFGNGCSEGVERDQPVRQREEAHDSRSRRRSDHEPLDQTPTDDAARCACWPRLLGYPDAELRAPPADEMRELLHAEAALSPRAAGRARRADRRAAARRRASTPRPTTCELFDRGRAHRAAPVRARARRLARPRPGDGRPGADLRAGRPAARPPASCPTTCRWCSSSPSTQPPREARAFLGEMRAHPQRASSARCSSATAPTPACSARCSSWPARRRRPVKLAAEEPLDESWAEPVVFDGCSSKGQARPGPAAADPRRPQEPHPPAVAA